MSRLNCILLLIAVNPAFVYSQTIIQGSVKNKEAVQIENVMVTIQDARTGTIVGFVSTDAMGEYRLSFKHDTDSLLVTVRGMAIENMTRTIPNRSATVNFIVNDNKIKLKEVRITPNPISRKSDTLSYVVDVFKGQGDRVIEDVLKKMPGINVASSGEISYNGKAISKFYIEDLDMLEGRYNIATKNIEAKDVASIQIYENISLSKWKIFSQIRSPLI